MSYDIMVFDRQKKFVDVKEFLNWYDEVTQYEEDIDYNDYHHATKNIQQWFLKIKDVIRPLNGEFAPPDEEIDNGEFLEADYSIGRDFVYAGLAWTDAERTSQKAFELAKKYGLGFFDISGTGEVYLPDGHHYPTNPTPDDNNNIEDCPHQERSNNNALDSQHQEGLDNSKYYSLKEECTKESNRRNKIVQFATLIYAILTAHIVMLCHKKALFHFTWLVLLTIVLILVFFVLFVWLRRWAGRAEQDVLEQCIQPESYDAESEETPEPLLGNVAWNFRLGMFDSQEEFYNAVIKYNEEVQGCSVEESLKAKINCMGQEVTFELFDEESEEAEKYQISQINLTCDDGESFSGIEVLYKLNQVLYPLLEDSDSTFFEGFNCWSLCGGPTICCLLLGS